MTVSIVSEGLWYLSNVIYLIVLSDASAQLIRNCGKVYYVML